MSFPSVGILCVHLLDRDGLTFYLVSELPPIGVCGVCYATHGRAVTAMGRELLEPMPIVLFERRKAKAFPVYTRTLERHGEG